MELAFINAILRSPGFPAQRPLAFRLCHFILLLWLCHCGHAGPLHDAVPGAVAFNLALASWFALTALAAYGLLYNLLAGRKRRKKDSSRLLTGYGRCWLRCSC
jgi:uncharacterized membrane protein